MSVRYEWIRASSARVTYIPPGWFIDGEPDTIGGPGLADGQTELGAVVLSYDEAVLLEGTPEQLLALAVKILEVVPDPDPTATVLRVARVKQVAVNHEDRDTIGDEIEPPLTDEEWARVVPYLDTYSEFMDNAAFASDNRREWLAEILTAAEVNRDDA